jgi:hypothetical protein
MRNTMVSAGGMTLLPASEGTCPECATAHDPALPHNQESLYYQTRFHMQHDRWPSWRDAAAHCTPEVEAMWWEALRREGVDPGPGREGDAP